MAVASGTKLMRALRFAEFGTAGVLRIEEVAIPEPGLGEALVRVKAAAIHPSDIGNVAGRFKKTTLPGTPGRDFAGVESFINSKSEDVRERVLELMAGRGARP